MLKPRKIIAGYLFVQAASVIAWWCLLIAVPASIDWFQPSTWPKDTLVRFWLPDLLMLGLGSAMAGLLVLREYDGSPFVLHVLAGAAWYPTLYCLSISIAHNDSWIACALMFSMASATTAVTSMHGSGKEGPQAIRVVPRRPSIAVAWTLAQTLIFWGLFLAILPLGIAELEDRLGVPGFAHPAQSLLAITLFVAASAVGIWSGLTMARVGKGTPLPTATAPNLVIVGPYRYVRNPMALAGILQGIAVGWYLGSYSVVAYALLGAIVWHQFVRPIEEADLLNRFGREYREYVERVGLWFPTIPIG